MPRKRKHKGGQKKMTDIDALFSIADTCRPPQRFPEAPTINLQWIDFRCPNCPDTSFVMVGNNRYLSGTRIMNDDGLPTCVSCGMSEKEHVSNEPEWNAGGEDGDDPCRVGAPVNTTLFSAAWGSGTMMSVSRASYANKRLARINFHMSMNHKDRALHHAYENMDRIGRGVLSLPENVMLQAKIMYRKFNESVLTRGSIRVGIKANCILRACQDAHNARTVQEVADAFGIPPKDISRTADMFRETIPSDTSTTTWSSDIVTRIFGQLNDIPSDIRGRLRQKAIRMCSHVEKHPSLMGKTPKGIAAAILYQCVAEYGVSKDTIAKLSEVSLPTLTKLEQLIRKISEV